MNPEKENLYDTDFVVSFTSMTFQKIPHSTIKAEALNSLTITFSLTISVSGIKSENKYEGYQKIRPEKV